MNKIETGYSEMYRHTSAEHAYPVEFVVRAFLGRQSYLARDVDRFPGRRILDLGFGDGRNVPLLSNLGLAVHGVEITDAICRVVVDRMHRLGFDLEACVGRSHRLPYEEEFFDYVLACHSCYYIEPGTTFTDNIAEIARVLRPGGGFVFSAPMASSYIMDGAVDLGGGHMEIARDPYGIRAGHILKKFDNEEDLRAALSPAFEDLQIGSCRNDFWGLEEHVWTVICRRVHR